MSTMFVPATQADGVQLRADVALFQSQALLQELFAAITEMFVVLNDQGQIVFANRSLLNALQCETIDDVAGQRLGEALYCTHAINLEDAHGDDPAGTCGTTEFCRECGAARGMLNSLRGVDEVQECRIVQADGSALDLRVTARPLYQAGRCYSLFAATDITHQKRHDVIDRVFLHDILNTAGGMLGVAEVLCTGTAEDVNEFKDTMALLANTLVDEIKAQQVLLAAERGELGVQVECVNSLTLLCDLRSVYMNNSVCLERMIEVDSNSDAVVFFSDSRLVRQVLSRMLKNALEGCRSGETASLRCRSTPEGVEFAVHNCAVIPPSVQPQVFQRSFSSKGAGRGLGTYSMKLLTEQYLQGSVTFDSTPEYGTTFVPGTRCA